MVYKTGLRNQYATSFSLISDYDVPEQFGSADKAKVYRQCNDGSSVMATSVLVDSRQAT